MPDAQVIVLRDETTGKFRSIPADEATEEERANALQGSKHRKAVWEHRSDGAQARAGTLPRALTASFAAGTVNLMLAKILQEEVVPATAKEAADVAKAAHEIYKSVAGVAPPQNLSAAEREQRTDTINAFEKQLAERAAKAGVDLGGALPPGESPVTPPDDDGDEPDVWEHEVPGPDAG